MNTIAQQSYLDEALELIAHNPACSVHVPDAPTRDELVSELTRQLMEDCAYPKIAREIDFDYEPLIDQQPEILRMVGQCEYDCHTKFWSQEERDKRYAVLGKEITDLVRVRFEAIAAHKLGV